MLRLSCIRKARLGTAARRLLVLLLPGLVLTACSARHSAKAAFKDRANTAGQGGAGDWFGDDRVGVSGSTGASAPLIAIVPSDYDDTVERSSSSRQPQMPAQPLVTYDYNGQPWVSRQSIDDMLSAAEEASRPRHARRAMPTPATAEGYYRYLVDAGFQLSSPKLLGPSDGAKNLLTFVLADGGRGHRMRVYEFANYEDARALYAALHIHRLTALCGPLVLTADFPLPEGQTEAGIENALDIYVAKAENGSLDGFQLAAYEGSEPPHQPIQAVRKMFMLSRDAVVYSGPTTDSAPIATVQEDHYVRVIDLLPNFLKVRLRNGLVGFLPEHAVELH